MYRKQTRKYKTPDEHSHEYRCPAGLQDLHGVLVVPGQVKEQRQNQEVSTCISPHYSQADLSLYIVWLSPNFSPAKYSLYSGLVLTIV